MYIGNYTERGSCYGGDDDDDGGGGGGIGSRIKDNGQSAEAL